MTDFMNGALKIDRKSLKSSSNTKLMILFPNLLETMKSTAEALNGESPRVHVVTAETSKDKPRDNKKEEVCLTPGCVHAASKMLEQMDQTVEPCDDFYEFACGQYVEDTIIPDDKVSVNAFSVISDKLQEQLRTIITSPIEDEEIEPFRMVKKLYLACMNKSKAAKVFKVSFF